MKEVKRMEFFFHLVTDTAKNVRNPSILKTEQRSRETYYTTLTYENS